MQKQYTMKRFNGMNSFTISEISRGSLLINDGDLAFIRMRMRFNFKPSVVVHIGCSHSYSVVHLGIVDANLVYSCEGAFLVVINIYCATTESTRIDSDVGQSRVLKDSSHLSQAY